MTCVSGSLQFNINFNFKCWHRDLLTKAALISRRYIIPQSCVQFLCKKEFLFIIKKQDGPQYHLPTVWSCHPFDIPRFWSCYTVLSIHDQTSIRSLLYSIRIFLLNIAQTRSRFYYRLSHDQCYFWLGLWPSIDIDLVCNIARRFASVISISASMSENVSISIFRGVHCLISCTNSWMYFFRFQFVLEKILGDRS